MSGDVCQNGSAILAQDCGPWVLGKFHTFAFLRPVIMSFTPVVNVDEVLASSMETVESLVPPRYTGDSDHDDWERVDDDVAVARATLAHNLSAHEDEVANSTLASFTTLDVDNTSLDERLQEMDAAMARLMTDEKAVVKEEAPPTGNIVPGVDPSEDNTAAAMDTDPEETRTTPGDFGSHTYPPCKKGRPPAWCLVCHFDADI